MLTGLPCHRAADECVSLTESRAVVRHSSDSGCGIQDSYDDNMTGEVSVSERGMLPVNLSMVIHRKALTIFTADES